MSAIEAIPVAAVDRFLLPVDERGVVRFFFDNLFVPHRLFERVARPIARSSGRPLGRRRGRILLGDRLALQTDDRRLSGWEACLDVLSTALRSGLAPEVEERERRWILMRGDAPVDGVHLVAFFFGAGPAPVTVLKLRRGPAATLEREAAALRQLAGRLPPGLQPSVPSVLAVQRVGDLEGLLLSALPGRSAYVEMQDARLPARTARRHLRAAGSWLAAFHDATREIGRRFVAEEHAGAGREALEAVPLAFSHGDFWARNLLLDGTRVCGTVDWENAAEATPVFEDLFHFPLTYGLSSLSWRCRRRPPEQAFRWTFLDETPLSREVRGYLEDYCAATGLEFPLLRPLFHLFLSRRARRGDEGGLWLRFQRMLTRANRSVFSG